MTGATSRPAAPRFELAEALDRLLERGVAVQGNLSVGLAGIDLLFLDLRLLLASVDTIWPQGVPDDRADLVGAGGGDNWPGPAGTTARPHAASDSAESHHPQTERDIGSKSANGIGSGEPNSLQDATSAKGLVRLVLTLVKLLHDVLEHQALRRMERGRLQPEEVEALGLALYAQAVEIERLRQQFGLADRDLSLDLGLSDTPRPRETP